MATRRKYLDSLRLQIRWQAIAAAIMSHASYFTDSHQMMLLGITGSLSPETHDDEVGVLLRRPPISTTSARTQVKRSR